MKKLLLSLLAVCLYPAMCFAGPFGTSMGDTIEKFSDATKMGEGTFVTSKMPKGHSDFESYILDFATGGLYQILAVSKAQTNDSYGIGSKRIYFKLKNQLTEKYGKPVCDENLINGSIWDEEREFIVSIFKKERGHWCEWSGSSLTDDLIQIRMMIVADSSNSSNVLLRYQYNNSTDAEKQKETSEKDSL